MAAEFAMARVRSTALETRARAGDAAALQALEISRRLDEYLTATQLGITLASLALGWLGEPALAIFIRPPLVALGLSDSAVHGTATVLAFTTISVLHIVVGELVPKSLAILRPEQVSGLTARPMTYFYRAMYPLLYVLNGVSNWLLRRAGLDEASEGHEKLSEDEIRLAVQATFGGENEHKRELLERVLRATDRPARSLMIPRMDMAMLNLDQGYDEWLEYARRHGFSRYPVSEDGNPDRIVGYLYVKDLLLAEAPQRADLGGIKRDLLFVPESVSVGGLLEEFKRTAIPMAIVVDEYGGTAGLVTVEDVVEELVGDIHDELDDNHRSLETREDGTLVADGTFPLGELPAEGLDQETRSSGDTLGGYIIDKLGRLAHPGDRLRVGRYDAVVEDVRRRRIGRVALRYRPPSTMPPPPELDKTKG